MKQKKQAKKKNHSQIRKKSSLTKVWKEKGSFEMKIIFKDQRFEIFSGWGLLGWIGLGLADCGIGSENLDFFLRVFLIFSWKICSSIVSDAMLSSLSSSIFSSVKLSPGIWNSFKLKTNGAKKIVFTKERRVLRGKSRRIRCRSINCVFQ